MVYNPQFNAFGSVGYPKRDAIGGGGSEQVRHLELQAQGLEDAEGNPIVPESSGGTFEYDQYGNLVKVGPGSGQSVGEGTRVSTSGKTSITGTAQDITPLQEFQATREEQAQRVLETSAIEVQQIKEDRGTQAFLLQAGQQAVKFSPKAEALRSQLLAERKKEIEGPISYENISYGGGSVTLSGSVQKFSPVKDPLDEYAGRIARTYEAQGYNVQRDEYGKITAKRGEEQIVLTPEARLTVPESSINPQFGEIISRTYSVGARGPASATFYPENFSYIRRPGRSAFSTFSVEYLEPEFKPGVLGFFGEVAKAGEESRPYFEKGLERAQELFNPTPGTSGNATFTDVIDVGLEPISKELARLRSGLNRPGRNLSPDISGLPEPLRTSQGRILSFQERIEAIGEKLKPIAEPTIGFSQTIVYGVRKKQPQIATNILLVTTLQPVASLVYNAPVLGGLAKYGLGIAYGGYTSYRVSQGKTLTAQAEILGDITITEIVPGVVGASIGKAGRIEYKQVREDLFNYKIEYLDFRNYGYTTPEFGKFPLKGPVYKLDFGSEPVTYKVTTGKSTTTYRTTGKNELGFKFTDTKAPSRLYNLRTITTTSTSQEYQQTFRNKEFSQFDRFNEAGGRTVKLVKGQPVGRDIQPLKNIRGNLDPDSGPVELRDLKPSKQTGLIDNRIVVAGQTNGKPYMVGAKGSNAKIELKGVIGERLINIEVTRAPVKPTVSTRPFQETKLTDIFYNQGGTSGTLDVPRSPASFKDKLLFKIFNKRIGGDIFGIDQQLAPPITETTGIAGTKALTGTGGTGGTGRLPGYQPIKAELILIPGITTRTNERSRTIVTPTTLIQPRVNTEINIDYNVRTRQPRLKEELILIPGTNTFTGTRPALDLGQPVREAQDIREEPVIIPTRITEIKIRQDIDQIERPEEKPPEEIIEGFKFKFEGPKEGGKQKDAYNVAVKERGQFKKVNKKPLPFKKAFNLGAEVVDNTPSATFKLLKSKEKTEEQDDFFTNLGYKFRKAGSEYIELISNRIDTQGEIQGITVKGWLAQRNKARFNI